MGSYSTVTIGKISLSYRGVIPDFYTFFFNDKHYYCIKDTEEDLYIEVGYKTTCSEALNLLQGYGYTIEFFTQVYEFFYSDLLEHLRQWLEMYLKNDTDRKLQDEDITSEIEAYLNSHHSTSKADELLDFARFIKILFHSDFKTPPFDRPYESGKSPYRLVVEAKEYFSSIQRYGVINIENFKNYSLANYFNFPHWFTMICILFDEHHFYAYDQYPEIIEFMFARLALEASDPNDEFKLEVSEIINEDFYEDDDPEEYLKSLHFDLAQNIIQKINLYNRVFKALFVNEESLRNQYVKARCKDLLNACDKAPTNNEKGRILEDLTEVLFTSNNFLTLVDKRVKTGDEEIDIVIQNNINRPFWLSFQSPLFFVECKNWKKPATASDLRNFEGKLRNHFKLVKVGFFVCLGGFTNEVMSELKRMGRDTQHIVLIDRYDINEYITSSTDFFVWLERRTSNFY